MTDQPEALLLAADLEMRPASYTRDMQTARLLREQHAEIEELREEVRKWQKSFGGHLYVKTEDYAELVGKLREQHAEIERLREANETFGKRQEWWNEKMFDMELEVERLRNALYYISLASQNSMSSQEECGRIARAALEVPR